MFYKQTLTAHLRAFSKNSYRYVLCGCFCPIRSGQCNFHLYRFGNHSPITDWNLYFHDCRLTVSFSCCNTHPLSRNMHSLSHPCIHRTVYPRATIPAAGLLYTAYFYFQFIFLSILQITADVCKNVCIWIHMLCYKIPVHINTAGICNTFKFQNNCTSPPRFRNLPLFHVCIFTARIKSCLMCIRSCRSSFLINHGIMGQINIFYISCLSHH